LCPVPSRGVENRRVVALKAGSFKYVFRIRHPSEREYKSGSQFVRSSISTTLFYSCPMMLLHAMAFDGTLAAHGRTEELSGKTEGDRVHQAR
jgi:hypothetical protein